jgi:hypothetical protein
VLSSPPLTPFTSPLTIFISPVLRCAAGVHIAGIASS